MLMLRIKSAAAVFSSFALVSYVSQKTTAISPAMGEMVNTFFNVHPENPEASCDPTYGPGWVSEEGHWQRSDNACQSSQFIQRFRDTPSSKYVDEFPTLVNKTMFILGDSVGRQLWDQLCFEIGAPKNVRYPPGVEPAVHYSEASVCTQPELNFTIVGFHQYGFANATDPTTLSYLEKCFPGGPYDYETRVPNLWNTLLTDIPEPDYISISGGAWDYLYMFNRDIIEKRFHNSIPEEDLKTFSGRLKGLIGMMGEMFPRSKVVWINMHPLNNVDLGAKHNWGGGYFQPPLDRSVDSVLFPPLFSQRRLAQHAQALRLAAEEEGVDSLDYWKLKDSFNSDDFWAPNDPVHPGDQPRIAMAEMMLEKLHRWSAYGV